eukprot:gene7862-1405_t
MANTGGVTPHYAQLYAREAQELAHQRDLKEQHYAVMHTRAAAEQSALNALREQLEREMAQRAADLDKVRAAEVIADNERRRLQAEHDRSIAEDTIRQRELENTMAEASMRCVSRVLQGRACGDSNCSYACIDAPVLTSRYPACIYPAMAEEKKAEVMALEVPHPEPACLGSWAAKQAQTMEQNSLNQRKHDWYLEISRPAREQSEWDTRLEAAERNLAGSRHETMV